MIKRIKKHKISKWQTTNERICVENFFDNVVIKKEKKGKGKRKTVLKKLTKNNLAISLSLSSPPLLSPPPNFI